MNIERVENGPFFVNTYIVGCPETREAILVDPGHESDRIAERIRAVDLRVVEIVNTHGHLDHIATARHFQTTLDVPFLLHRDDAFLVEPDAIAASCARFGLPAIEAPEVTDWLEAGTTRRVGSLSYDLRFAPGHSPGSVMLDFGEVMLVGDVIFAGSVGRTDLPRGDMPTLLSSIRREVLVKSDTTALHPGHGPKTTVGVERTQNPFL